MYIIMIFNYVCSFFLLFYRFIIIGDISMVIYLIGFIGVVFIGII